MSSKVVFARIGWMKRYKGKLADDEKPIGGGENNKLNIGHELFNFLRVRTHVRGYFQPPLQPRARRKTHPSTVHLERISPGFTGDVLKNALVVFIASDPAKGGQCIVGWYSNATVYRYEQHSPKSERDGYGYYVETKAGEEVLVPWDGRSFTIPHGKGGLGRANICYVYEGDGRQKTNSQWMEAAVEYVSSYQRDNAAEQPASETDNEVAEIVSATVERGAGYQSNPRIRKAIEKYAMDWALKRLIDLKLEPQDMHTTKPYDFLCSIDGDDLYVEVKGTQDSGRCVCLTPGEVRHIKKHRSALFIVYSVKVKGKRAPVVSGGQELFIRDWDLTAGKLEPRGYTYSLPASLLPQSGKSDL